MSLLNETNFESCTKCTICTEYCPVSAVFNGFPGPKQSGPDGARLRLKDPALYDEALKYCTNCKRCEIVCPSNVKIGDIIQLAKEKYSKKRPPLRDAILSHTDFMGTLATPFAPIVNTITGFPPTKLALDAILKIPKERILPTYSFGTFRGWFKRNAAKEQAKYHDQVAIFHGCYINYNNPSLGRDVVKVLNALDVGVSLLKKERCCGVPLISNKFFGKAKKQAKFNVKYLNQAVIEDNVPVIVPSSTCCMALRNEYPRILEVDTSPIRNKIDLATRYVHRLLESGRTPKMKPLNLNVAYHIPCHLERLGWSGYSIDLLRRIPGVTVHVLDPYCCGIAGTYGFKKENYTNAQNIGSPQFKKIEELGVDLVVSDCEACKWQIEMSTSKKCEHPLTVFAQALV